MKEQKTVLSTQVNGETAIVMPITKLECIEDTATSVDSASDTDYVPVIDSADEGQMKKITVGNLLSNVKIKTVSVIITTTGWLSDDDSKYPFYYDISVPEATAYDRADVRIMPNSIEAALAAGFDTKTDTREGYIRIRAKSAPTAVISAEYQIFGGAV